MELKYLTEKRAENQEEMQNLLNAAKLEKRALTEDEIKRMRLEKINVDLKVNIGDKVKIISGPLADFVGDVQEVDAENQKCKVTVSMFGRPTPVEVDFDQIEIV